MKKLLALLLVVCMILPLAACGKKEVKDGTVVYTYHTYSSSLATKWNPHNWDTNADSGVLSYITTPFVGMSIKDSANGVYQWTYLAADSIEDVTAAHQDDLTKYAVNLAGAEANTVTEGYVFEFKLNKDLKWEDGKGINADDYVESFKRLMDPAMKNYRANLYYSGESAVAGGAGYFYAGSVAPLDNYANAGYEMADLVKGADGTYATPDGDPVFVALDTTLSWVGRSLADCDDAGYMGNYLDGDAYAALRALADEDGNVALTDDALALVVKMITFSPQWGEDESNAPCYFIYKHTYPQVGYETVGMYKVDDYTIRYVTENPIDINYFLTSCTDNWLVDTEMYDAKKDTSGELVTTAYGTSLETTKSYGPYKLTSFQADKQMVFDKNPYFYAYKADKDGRLVGTTTWDVDGEKREWNQTDRVVIDVMTDDAAKQAFLKGELADWTPSADELTTYALSDQLYKVDETYSMSFFFNTDLDALKTMDASKGNTNSVVLSNTNFRKAFSLSIDRAEWVGATQGYKPTYGLMNTLYFYNIYDDPTSMYRNSPQAKQAICDLYGVKYGAGEAYADLDAAYASINGYNLTEAKELMAKAFEELKAAGVYSGGDITIRIAYSAGALDSSQQQQVALMNKYINNAAEGSGFGKITLEAVGSVESRYAKVPAGEFAIGYGAWGGAAFYPFRNFQVYFDPDQYDVNEVADWDPTTETLTINIGGEDVTMTFQQWGNCMVGAGRYAGADFDTKLNITATLEKEYLSRYYRIPLATSTSCSMLSYQVKYYTNEYNIMYGFGGLDLMTYNYTDAEWAQFVKDQGGQLNYE